MDNLSHTITASRMDNVADTVITSGTASGVKNTTHLEPLVTFDFDEIVKRIEKKFSAPKMKSVSCLHCGAPLEMKVDDHIVNCAYCHSVYAIDMEMIRDLR